jgi:hypothetical protein
LRTQKGTFLCPFLCPFRPLQVSSHSGFSRPRLYDCAFGRSTMVPLVSSSETDDADRHRAGLRNSMANSRRADDASRSHLWGRRHRRQISYLAVVKSGGKEVDQYWMNVNAPGAVHTSHLR